MHKLKQNETKKVLKRAALKSLDRWLSVLVFSLERLMIWFGECYQNFHVRSLENNILMRIHEQNKKPFIKFAKFLKSFFEISLQILRPPQLDSPSYWPMVFIRWLFIFLILTFYLIFFVAFYIYVFLSLFPFLLFFFLSSLSIYLSLYFSFSLSTVFLVSRLSLSLFYFSWWSFIQPISFRSVVLTVMAIWLRSVRSGLP